MDVSILGLNTDIESEVRSYCRAFSTIFDKAQGAVIYDAEGKGHLDFLSAC